MHTFDNVDSDNLVSSILINVADGYSVDEVMNDINIHVRKVEAVRTQNMISNVSDGLANISGIVTILVGAIWLLTLIILILVFTMIGNERKKEFAILRGMGASRKELSLIMTKESFYVCIIGSVIGALLGTVTIVLFANFVRSSLNLPFLTSSDLSIVCLFIISVAVSIFAGVCSSIGCVRKVSKVDTALILRGDN
jgi:putative ABC transport system permease protein